MALSTSCRKRSSGQEASGPVAHCGIVTKARSGPSAWLGLGLGLGLGLRLGLGLGYGYGYVS